MIPNIQSCCCCCCCRQCSDSNENFYIEVRNETSKYVNFILGYKIHGKRVMKPSGPIMPGRGYRMVFPGDAQRLCLRIYDASVNPPAIICSRFPAERKISRYKVVTNAIGVLQCVDI